LSDIELEPVPDRLNGFAPGRFKVPVWAPDDIEKVDVLPLFSFVVITEPPTVTEPDSRSNTPSLKRLLLV
jgi:hypothetical protein